MSNAAQNETGSIARGAAAGEPAWDVARLFPNQGFWSVEEFLDVTSSTNRLVEYSDGFLEVMPMPTLSHQLIVQLLFRLLDGFCRAQSAGRVIFAGYPVRLKEQTYREPDILFVRSDRLDRMGEKYAAGADLVMEVVSSSNRDHDLVTKRREYAQAGIPEYWIVDPIESRIVVLTLPEGATEYAEHGTFVPGQRATSVLLPGFAIDAAAALKGEE
jgi:Uma2 family endonuclease